MTSTNLTLTTAVIRSAFVHGEVALAAEDPNAPEPTGGEAFDQWAAEFEVQIRNEERQKFDELDTSFLTMRNRVAGYADAPPLASRRFEDGASAFEWAATQTRRARDSEALLVPPTPEQLEARRHATDG